MTAPLRLAVRRWSWAALALLATSPVLAQAPSLGDPAPAAAVTAAATGDAAAGDRDRLFEEVAREALALERQMMLLKRVVVLVKPAVVHIEAKKSEAASVRLGGRRPVEEAGSGVIIQLQDAYYVLTNRHVVNNAPLAEIQINLADGRRIYPSKVWSDEGTDVSVLAVTAPNLVAARLGNSDTLDIGDFVLAMGSPFGLSHSVTYGIISAKGRRDLQLGQEGVRYQDFLQTDAAINPGNSGGPLINLRAEVVGINTAIASSSGGNEGIGFTIPINMAMVIARQLVERGAVARAFLGVHLDSTFGSDAALRLGLPRKLGARVTGITPNSPAATSELRAGDVILQFDGVTIEDDNHLINLVSLTPIGKDVPLVVYREGQPRNMQVKVTDRTGFDQAR